MHRRDFLLRCGLATSGLLAASAGPSLLLPQSFGALVLAPVITADPSTLLNDTDRAVLGLVGNYSTSVSLRGGGLAARYLGTATAATASLGVLAYVADPSRLIAFLRSGALNLLNTVQAGGNRLVFRLAGTDYTVDNLGSDDYNAAVQNAQNDGSALAHDNLLFNPATGIFNDPGRVLKRRTISLSSTPTTSLAGLTAVLAGRIDSVRYGLPLDASFSSYANSLLATAPATADEADALADQFLASVATLANTLNRADLEALVRTSLLAEALGVRLNRAGEDFAGTFESLRASLPDTTANPDAAVWLAALLGPELRAGEATNLLFDPTRDDLWVASAAALPAARAIAANH